MRFYAGMLIHEQDLNQLSETGNRPDPQTCELLNSRVVFASLRKEMLLLEMKI